ncbi:O-antigen polymerase [Companilactobacillus halodurans]|uniref:O-antigen polymerase n=1 Tax=Companilactobacillus halodurans TaxID=2584183 RepID=UPI001295E7B7|nr:O-antigen polymerase [Companilactobacillus halodurans]
MTLFLNFVCIAYSIIVLISSWNKRVFIPFLCLAVFDLLYVFPILIELILGDAHTGYYGFILAQNDVATSIVYSIFVLTFEILFYIYIKSQAKKNKKFYLMESMALVRDKLSNSKMFLVLFGILLLIPIFGIIFAPNPADYFKIGAFPMNRIMANSDEIAFNDNIAKFCKYFGFLGIIGIKLYDKNHSFILLILRIVSLISVTLLDGKRTLFAFLILILFAIDFIFSKNKSRLILKGFFLAVVISLYFVLYSYVTGKYEYNTNWYSVISEYFFKGNAVKVAIYSVLHPDKLHILDYHFQTFYYDLFYFVPRNIWLSKPLTYPDYYSSAVFGFETVRNVGWYFQTNVFAEFISNIGIMGVFLGPLFILLLCNVVNNSKNLFSMMFGVSFIVLIELFEYSDLVKIVFLIWVILLVVTKLSRRIRFSSFEGVK